jgi:predicted TIM-barrel fold metal-dependent hydrolase
MPWVIDIHTHMWDYGWLPEPHKMNMAIRAAKRRRPPVDPMTIRPRVGNGFMDPSGNLNVKILDRLGMDMGVIQVVDWAIGYGVEADNTIEEINAGTAQAVRNHPDRLMWFCGIDPRRPGAAEKFERWVKEDGAKGFKLYPPMGFYPWDDCVKPIIEKAIELDVPILSHTQAGVSWCEPIHWGQVCRQYPDLKVILGHAGVESPFFSTYGWEQAVIVAARHENVYLDPTEWHLWGALKDIPELIRRIHVMKTNVGAEKVVNGTDNPLGRDGADNGDGEWMFIWRNLPTIGRWFGYTFTQEDVDLMLGENAARLLRLPAKEEARQAAAVS